MIAGRDVVDLVEESAIGQAVAVWVAKQYVVLVVVLLARFAAAAADAVREVADV